MARSRTPTPLGGGEGDSSPGAINGFQMAAGVQPCLRLDVAGVASVVAPPLTVLRRRARKRTDQALDLVERQLDGPVADGAEVPE